MCDYARSKNYGPDPVAELGIANCLVKRVKERNSDDAGAFTMELFVDATSRIEAFGASSGVQLGQECVDDTK